jgi:hypothetical protein
MSAAKLASCRGDLGHQRIASGLAELLALAKAERSLGRDPIDHNLTASDGIKKTEPDAVGISELRTVP